MFSVFVVMCLVVSSALAQEQVIKSNSAQSLNALKATLFGNLTVGSDVDSALSEYGTLSENSGSSLNEIINGLKQLLNKLPSAQQTILRENLDKQRENLQSYLEETDSVVSKANSSSGNQCFLVVNSGLASYMTLSDSANNYDGNQICVCMVSLGTEFPSVSTVTYNRLSFNVSSPVARELCQTQVFGLIVAATGGSKSATDIIQSALSKVSALQNTVNNAMDGLQSGAQTAVDYASNAAQAVGSAAQSAGDSLSNVASNIQNSVSG
uniref:DUF148 domain-containing protein n=1 Tax=Panagrellus redivivus TaxID=6233 RepID=A0A7E4VX35_PANRE